MAEDGRGNGTGAQGLWTRRAPCLHRPRHVPGLVRRPWHNPGQRRTQKVRRGGGDREIWPTGLTSTVLAERPPIASPARSKNASLTRQVNFVPKPDIIR